MTLAPIVYLPHGGGPLPLMNDAAHAALARFLAELPRSWPALDGVVMCSAHWETDAASVTAAPAPKLIHDYGGFPPEAYTISYPAPGDPGLATEIVTRLRSANMHARLDPQRGFDHGMFVPMKLMFPQADLPCVQVSLRADLDPGWHVNVGKQLQALRQRNIAIVGSGMSFHDMRALVRPDADSREASEQFSDWLVETCTSPSLTPAQREARLVDWRTAPGGLSSHPREEHLLPLHVCFGAAMTQTPCAQVIFDQTLLGHRTIGLAWS